MDQNEMNGNVTPEEGASQENNVMSFGEWRAQRKAARAEKKAAKKAARSAESFGTKAVRGLKVLGLIGGGVALTYGAFKAGMETARQIGHDNICDTEIDPEPGDDCEAVNSSETDQEEE